MTDHRIKHLKYVMIMLANTILFMWYIKKNGGLSPARNSGIEWAFKNSDSQWITFIDSDDWVHPQYLELLLNANITNSTSIFFSKLYNIPSTGLRFFTVYGPAGRPDMAYFGFTNKLIKGETIQIFNYGNCKRDFTFVDDIVEGVMRIMQGAPERKIGEDGLPLPPYAVYNIGNSSPENLLDFVDVLQQELVRAEVLPADYNFEEHKKLVPMQPGDVPATYADTSALERDFGFKPSTSLREGLRKFTEWYKEFYQI